ncbi:unnamed protein product [Clonostachys rosea]|uniref:Uncharacterized protein n=1 Tax=Bionectria ochroleuca TaxID=29856 RepID=A0ABY6UR49_BIOOC|nr:unnamed protein product [Clonostachys rosea]
MSSGTEPPTSKRACSHPVGNGPYAAPVNGKGCGWCDNQDKYGYGSSSIYFGGKWALGKLLNKENEDRKEKEKGKNEGN